jgi:hypothetical protein
LPKTRSRSAILENAESTRLELAAEELDRLRHAFAPPDRDFAIALPPYGPLFYALAGVMQVLQSARRLRSA